MAGFKVTEFTRVYTVRIPNKLAEQLEKTDDSCMRERLITVLTRELQKYNESVTRDSIQVIEQ